jgi:hypothetical protein
MAARLRSWAAAAAVPREEAAAVAASGCSATTPTWAGTTPASPDHPAVG